MGQRDGRDAATRYYKNQRQCVPKPAHDAAELLEVERSIAVLVSVIAELAHFRACFVQRCGAEEVLEVIDRDSAPAMVTRDGW